MAIKRAKRETNFTIMSNVGLRDERLSWKARGLLAYMLSLPDDWVFYETELVKRAPDGLSGVRSGLKELEEHGFLVRVRERDENGRLKGSDWIIHDEPICDYPTLDKPILEKPTLEKPILDNHTLLSTNCTKDLKELNTNNTKSNNSRKSDKRTYDENSIHYQLSHVLFEEIKKNNPEVRTPNFNTWSDDIRKMMELDGRKEAQVRNMIQWSQGDSFWKGVILSAKKLREKYDQMKVQALPKPVNKGFKGQAQKKEMLPDWATQEQPQEDKLLDVKAQRKYDERLKRFRKGSTAAAGETR